MDGADGSKHFEEEVSTTEQRPSLLAIILDTNPAAWALLDPVLSISGAVANLLVFINAHLACNYTNQVAVIASHCDKAQWLYPTATAQKPPQKQQSKTTSQRQSDDEDDDAPPNRNKRIKLNVNGTATKSSSGPALSDSDSNKYRPYRLIEDELVRNLRNLMSTTSPDIVQEKSSTMIAGALSLALSYINRCSQELQESLTGISSSLADQSAATTTDPDSQSNNSLQSRILIITLSPSADLAHQYIPIMNSIFACQRLNIPIDVLQLPLLHDSQHQQAEQETPANPTTAAREDATVQKSSQTSTVFLQQASDATHGIFILARLTPPSPRRPSSPSPPEPTSKTTTSSIASQSMLSYLLTSFLPTPSSRLHLITPTRIDVDFRAACFCHRNIIPIGYVCSICLSIFCDQSLEDLDRDGCLTCGTKLSVRGSGLGSMGKGPVVVARKKKKRRRADEGASGAGTPRPVTPA